MTIIPRGRALGLTMQLPEEDRYSHDRDYLLARIAVLMGGRIAEEIFMKQMTTGASNDFEVATNMAYNMAARWGMSDALCTRVYAESEQEMMSGQKKRMSGETAKLLDSEVSRIIDEEYDRAKTILEENREKVEVMTRSLMEWETIDALQIAEIMEGKDPTPPADLPEPKTKKSDDDSEGRPSIKPQMDKPASDA